MFWEGMAHLLAKGETLYPDRDYTLQFELDYTNHGRRIVRQTLVSTDEIRKLTEQREDGKTHTSILWMHGDPEVVDRVVMKNQEHDAEHYAGPMFPLFWVFLPDGRPLHVHLNEGATIERLETDNLYLIKSMRKRVELPLLITVDRDRDWLPRKIVIGDEETVIEVTDFGLDNGRWFPIKGQGSSKKTDDDGQIVRGREQFSFSVSGFQFNTPIDPNDYSIDLGTLHDGVLVSNETTGEEFIVGENQDRTRIYEQFSPDLPLNPRIEGINTEGIDIFRKPQNDSTIRWIALVIVFIVAICVVGAFTWRSRSAVMNR